MASHNMYKSANGRLQVFNVDSDESSDDYDLEVSPGRASGTAAAAAGAAKSATNDALRASAPAAIMTPAVTAGAAVAATAPKAPSTLPVYDAEVELSDEDAAYSDDSFELIPEAPAAAAPAAAAASSAAAPSAALAAAKPAFSAAAAAADKVAAADADAVMADAAPAEVVTIFEGKGLEASSAKAAAGQDAAAEDFDYAFEGGQRKDGFHTRVFKPQAAPAALITDVRTKPLGAVEEDGEEEEEDIAVSLSSGALSPAGGNWPMADTPLSGLGAGSERPSSGWNTFPINTTVGNTDVSGAAVGGEEQARPEGLSRQLSSELRAAKMEWEEEPSRSFSGARAASATASKPAAAPLRLSATVTEIEAATSEDDKSPAGGPPPSATIMKMLNQAAPTPVPAAVQAAGKLPPLAGAQAAGAAAAAAPRPAAVVLNAEGAAKAPTVVAGPSDVRLDDFLSISESPLKPTQPAVAAAAADKYAAAGASGAHPGANPLSSSIDIKFDEKPAGGKVVSLAEEWDNAVSADRKQQQQPAAASGAAGSAAAVAAAAAQPVKIQPAPAMSAAQQLEISRQRATAAAQRAGQPATMPAIVPPPEEPPEGEDEWSAANLQRKRKQSIDVQLGVQAAAAPSQSAIAKRMSAEQQLEISRQRAMAAAQRAGQPVTMPAIVPAPDEPAGEDEWSAANLQRMRKQSLDVQLMQNAGVPLAGAAAAAAKPSTAIPKLATGAVAPVPAAPAAGGAGTSRPILYAEASSQLMRSDVSRHEAEVRASLPVPVKRGFLSRLLCFAQPTLTGELLDEFVQMGGVARIPFDPSDATHAALLQALYVVFTRKPTPPERVALTGPHWAEVGFQGDNPATDLRSCGMLGLLHLYFLFNHHDGNAAKLFQLSHDREQEFPLAVVSLNITKWALQAAREGQLTAAARRTGSLIRAAELFYVGTFYEFYKRWLNGRKTMRDSGFVLKDLEEHSRKRANAMIALATSML